MNLLLSGAPKQVKIGGRNADINSDFRTGIRFEVLMLSDLAADEKLYKALKLFYREKIPDFLTEEAVNSLLWFYCGGEIANKSDSENNNSSVNDIFDYEYDSGYIFAAFMQQYGIDLEKTKYLHWWKFKALLQALGENTEFVKILTYRTIKITSDMPEKEQAFYRKMKARYALPLPADEQEKQDLISEALKNGQSIADLI